MPAVLNNADRSQYDLTRYDLKTGRKIFSLAEDFGLTNVARFEIEKDTLFFVENGRLHSAKFWPLNLT